MKTNFLLLQIFFHCLSCVSQDNSKGNQMVSDNLKIDFAFYPSSGGESVYEVSYNNLFLTVTNREEQNSIYSTRFNDIENQSVLKIVGKLKPSDNIATEIILDSWRIELKINDKVYYNKSGVRIKELPSDIRKLLNLLIKNSNVRIDLYDFS